MKKLRNTDKLIPAIFFIFLIFVWQIVCALNIVDSFVLPAPSSIVSALIREFWVIVPHVLITLKEAAIGFSLSIVFAVALAVIMDNISIIKKAVYPLLLISQTIPIIALAPLFVIWFGFGQLPKIIVVIVVCFFPIAISLLDGFAATDTDTECMLRSMGASRFQIMWLLKLPSASVNFFSGLRIAATYSIMGAVIGEWLGGSQGIGVYMMRVRKSFALDEMFAAIIIIVVLSMLLFWLLTVIEDAVMPWHKLQRKNLGGNE